MEKFRKRTCTNPKRASWADQENENYRLWVEIGNGHGKKYKWGKTKENDMHCLQTKAFLFQ